MCHSLCLALGSSPFPSAPFSPGVRGGVTEGGFLAAQKSWGRGGVSIPCQGTTSVLRCQLYHAC